MNILKFYLVTILVVISSILYVHQHIEIIKLNYILKNNEQEVMQLLDQNAALMYNIEKLESPSLLEEKLQSSKAVFTMPRELHTAKWGKPEEEVKVATSLKEKRSFFDFLVPKALAQVKPTR